MMKIDESKLIDSELLFTVKYGAPGTEERKKFEEEAHAYYYGTILRNRRKELKMTQQDLANKVGTARSYIAKIERGNSDIQMSSFMRILAALNIRIELKMG